MNAQKAFIKDVASAYLSAVASEEVDYLDVVLGEMQGADFALPGRTGQEIRFSTGTSDVLRSLASPVVIAVLAVVWKDLIAPVAARVISESISERRKGQKESNGVKAELTEVEVRDFVRSLGQTYGLDWGKSDHLARQIVHWLRSHQHALTT